MAYNPERHHRRSIRLKNYDYAEAGAYFVTICIEQRECLLGEVIDGQMLVSEWGQIAGEIWEQIAEHWPMVDLDAFVIMPNHLHGIVIIRDESEILQGVAEEEGGGGEEGGAAIEGGGTPPLQGRPKPTLGSVIAYWKYQTSKRINTERQTPGARLWQRNYYDRIIRSAQMLDKARNYIAHNPGRWSEDADNPINMPFP